MKQDDDNPSDPSNLMPIQVGLHSPASVPPQYHPFWTGQTMEKPPSDGTPSSSFPSSSGQGYSFKTERLDGMTSDSSKSPQQNAFQFSQGFNPAYPNGAPPLAFANGVPVMRFPNSLPSSMFPGGMPSLAVNNDALIWRMLMDTYTRMTNHRNELMKDHMNHLQMQNSVEYPMQFAAMDQRAMAHSTPSKLHENPQQSRPSFSSMENFGKQTMGSGYSSPLPNNTLDLSASKKKSSRARKMGKKSSPIPQLDEPQNLIKNFSSEGSITHPLAFSSPYPPFAYPNSLSVPHFATTTSNPSPSSINVKSEPVINDSSKTLDLPPINKETVAQSKIQSPDLRSHEVLAPDQSMSCSTGDPMETGSGHAERDIRQNKCSEMQESLSRSSAQKTPPEVALKQELTSEENLLYTSGDGAEVSDVRGGSPWSDKRQPSPAENENVCIDSSGSGRSLGFSLYSAPPSQHAATSLRRKKILRCRRCSFMTTEKEAFYKHKYEHFPPERLMVCTECTFVTQLKHHFQYHINTHKGVRPYPCSLCDYRGTNLAMLKSHLKTHKKYSCADCEYSAASIEILQAHMNAENHKSAPVLNTMRVMSRVVDLANKRKNTNSRHPGGLKTRKRFALNGSQTDSVALPTKEPTDTFPSPLNAFHLSQSFGPSHLSPQNQLGGLGVGGSSAVWPGSLNLWPAAFPLAGSPGQLASSFGLPQPLPFSAKSSENPLLTCEFCSFSTSNRSHLMHHVTSQHRQLLNSILQSSKLPLDGSSGSQPMSHNRKSMPPRTMDSSALPSPSLNSGANPLPHFSGNNHAADNCSTDTSVVAGEKMDSQVSHGQANPVLPLDLSCVQEPCQKPSRRKGVARKLAVEQIEDEDVTKYFSDFLPTPQEFCDKSVAGVAEHVSDSRERSEMRSDPKMETESDELIQESQNNEQVDPLQETSRPSPQRLLSKPGDKPNLISGKNCKESSVSVPLLLDEKQEGDERKDSQLDTANRNATASKKSPSKTYKCHHCGIIFLDYILYSMHSGYHNFDDPLRCNICGRRSNDIHEFYTHIGKYAHPES